MVGLSTDGDVRLYKAVNNKTTQTLGFLRTRWLLGLEMCKDNDVGEEMMEILLSDKWVD